jgi:hypothetical protein
MSNYNLGITETNTQVRRLGYLSALIWILKDRSMSEQILVERIQSWSADHQSELSNYTNSQGSINTTKQKTAAMRYINFALALGMLGRISNTFRLTRFAKPVANLIIYNDERNSFHLSLYEKIWYLYWLLIKDGDRLLTIFDLLLDFDMAPLGKLQKEFKSYYLRRLHFRSSVSKESVAREILIIRRRIQGDWKSPQRYAETIVPPRLNWLLDLGLVSIENTRGKPAALTATGKLLLIEMRKSNISELPTADIQWLNEGFFSSVGRSMGASNEKDCSASNSLVTESLIETYLSQAFNLLRSSNAPKISLLPALLYVCTCLAVKNNKWIDIEVTKQMISESSLLSKYQVRFSHRENESYITISR